MTNLEGTRVGESHFTSEGGGEGERDLGCRAYECSILPNCRTRSDCLQNKMFQNTKSKTNIQHSEIKVQQDKSVQYQLDVEKYPYH